MSGSILYVNCNPPPPPPPPNPPPQQAPLPCPHTCPPSPCEVDNLYGGLGHLDSLASGGAGGVGGGNDTGGRGGPSGLRMPPPMAGTTRHPIRYSNGAVLLTQADLAVPQGGFFSHVRYYCNQAGSYAGPNGNNWWVGQLPFAVASGTSVAVAFDPNNPYWFDWSGTDYVPRYGTVGVTLVEDTGAATLTFTQTVNGTLTVTVFNDLTVSPNPGGLISHTDARGITTTATYTALGTLQQLSRSFTSGTSTINEMILYGYNDSGSALGNLSSVLLLRDPGTGTWTAVAQMLYDYYPGSDPNGSVNDLKLATKQLPDGSGGWMTVAVEYYRYWLGTEATGIPHGLKMHFGPEAYRLLFNASINLDTASDATILPYVDHYFEYDPTSASVTKEIAAVCPTCPGGGTTTDLFAYTPNPRSPSPGYNIWATKTVQTLPDSSKNIVYTNYAGMTMLMVTVDPGGTNQWCTFYRYNSDGQLIWTAQPSAVNGYDDTYDDLLNFNTGTSLYAYLNNSTGLIHVTNYYTTTGSGAVLDYVENQNVRQGQSGSNVLLRSFTYTSNIDSAGNAVYPVATVMDYPDATNTSITITTGYAYTFYTGTNQIQQKTTTLPVVGSGQNGSGSADTTVEEYDTYGNLTQRTDERGIVSTFTYADQSLGRVTEQALDTAGVNLVTDFTYDDQGRLIQTMGLSHTVVLSGTATTVRGVTWNVYNLSAQPTSGPGVTPWGPDATWIGTGYATGTGPSYTYTLIDPVSINNTDKDGRSTDQIMSVRSSGSGALSPTDTFNQSDWQSWSSTQYDNQHRTISSRTYFLIPSSGTGTVGTNYGETDFGYDALERQNRVDSPVGTITRTVWTTPQWVASTWMGTDDTGATDSDPTGGGATGNNMVQITANVYDGGSAGGDGNLTQVTQYAAASDTRVTGYGYDFRDRRTSTTDATNRYTVYTYDNLDRQTQVQSYVTGTGNLYAQRQTNFDDRSRVYQTLTYAVDPSTGTVGNALTSNIWFDPSGNVLQQIAQGDAHVFSKSSYNGVNWLTASYRGYNTSGTSYTQAGTVSGDIIMAQSIPTYNEVGSVTSTTSYDRLNDASTSTTGALTSSNARISYSASWFDGIDRPIASANYGAASSFTRPTTPPSSSSTVLVSSTTYSSAGRVYQTTDPKGIITQMAYDAAGRTTQAVEDQGGLNRTTNTTYMLDNQIATMTAINSTTGDQTTIYTYGTTLADSGVARNDLLGSTAYPDASPAWATLSVDDWANLTVDQWASLPVPPDVTTNTYNRLGQRLTFTDQRSTVRTFYYDKLGRQTNDCVSTNGTGTDVTVKQIATAYEVRGLVQTVSSTDSATAGSGTVLNQVAMTYNTFGQLTKEQQDHGGAVSGSTPNVQYAYDSGGSSSNEIRLNQLTYPNGRTIGYSFGTSGGMNDRLNRLDTIADTTSGTTNLASYTYLGLGTVVRITYPQPSVWLDLWGGTSGTFAGLDLFNRIVDQNWQNNITGTPTDIDRYKYGYDLDSNRQWKQNVVASAASVALDEYYTYDNLNRLTQMQRGTLNGTFTGITGTPVKEQDWTLDPTGNWSAYLTKTSGTTDLNQTRTANPVNEITAIGGTPGWATPPAYDPAGNMTSFPQPATPSSSIIATYDAWNRMVQITDGTNTVAKYSYDGTNRRNIKYTYTSGTLSETRHFYYTSQWQDIEERVGTATTMDKQYVWGVRYVDELVCRDDATPQRLYACQDANFNLTSITNTTGSVVERYMFTPYGTRSIYDASWTSRTTSSYAWLIGYQGLLHDDVSYLILSRFRYFHPALGQFITRDPLGERSGVNAYLRGTPTTKLDPSGLDYTGINFSFTGTAVGANVGGRVSLSFSFGYDSTAGRFVVSFGASQICGPGAGAILGAGPGFSFTGGPQPPSTGISNIQGGGAAVPGIGAGGFSTGTSGSITVGGNLNPGIGIAGAFLGSGQSATVASSVTPGQLLAILAGDPLSLLMQDLQNIPVSPDSSCSSNDHCDLDSGSGVYIGWTNEADSLGIQR